MAAADALLETALPATEGSRDEDKEEKEEQQCRIWRLPAEAGRPLCSCIRFVMMNAKSPRSDPPNLQTSSFKYLD
jgi:hypothetical protein